MLKVAHSYFQNYFPHLLAYVKYGKMKVDVKIENHSLYAIVRYIYLTQNTRKLTSLMVIKYKRFRKAMVSKGKTLCINNYSIKTIF